VAIAGCGAISAVGCGLESLRIALRSNASGLRSLERFAHSRFQSSVVGAAPLNGKNRSMDDPAWHLASEAIQQARAQATAAGLSVLPERLGLVLSTTKANVEALERLADNQPCSESARRHLRPDLLAADLAMGHNARGPVQCVSVACVSGLIALQQAARLIQRNAADAIIVAGVDHLSAFVVAGFTSLKALDPIGCRPFDKDRCGLSPGEAGAAIILARSEFVHGSAIKLAGWGASNDANHMTGPSRDGSGLVAAIISAFDSAQLSPGSVDYVNAHGTGTPYNDAMEFQALNRVFGAQCPPLSGSKGMLGHTLGAAGVIETILCVIAMQEGLLPGTPRLTSPTEGAPANLLREPRAGVALKSVLKLNTGFGGINGALILAHG
jgi:3-oxoacyl-(acyl-carrier-protein) synthase